MRYDVMTTVTDFSRPRGYALTVIDLNMAVFANSKTVVYALLKNGTFLVGWRTLRSATSARKFDTKLTGHFFPNEETRISEHVLRCGNWPVFSIFAIFQCTQFLIASPKHETVFFDGFEALNLLFNTKLTIHTFP